jgi:AcrR family transcriptional regulator
MSRAYRSVRRVEQAATTRRVIIEAAHHVFAQRGYAAATVAAIAEVAQVAVPTVYASVGGKPAILAALQERMDDESDALTSVQSIHSATDPLQVVHVAISVARRINERFGDIIAVWYAAAASEPNAAAAVAEGLRRHRAGMHVAAERLAELGALRPGVSVEQAGQTLGVLTAPGAWQAMVGDYGWSWDAAADWVASMARTAILADPDVA